MRESWFKILCKYGDGKVLDKRIKRNPTKRSFYSLVNTLNM